MRTFITVFSIIFLLISLICCEKIFVIDFCNEFTDNIKTLQNSLESLNNPSGKIEQIKNNWEKQKNNIFIFANHNNFNEIESGIYNIEYSIKEKEYKKALFYSDNLYHRVDELFESTKFNMGNLL